MRISLPTIDDDRNMIVIDRECFVALIYINQIDGGTLNFNGMNDWGIRATPCT